VGEAIAYSLEGEGKRLRAALLFAAFRELGGAGDAAGLAAAVEVVHTYSLVHDDLPCMDDDDLRRGRPTTHRAFDVDTATRAGFLMVPLAARVLADGCDALGLERKRRARLGRTLFEAVGVRGMIGGQVLDLEGEDVDLSAEALTAVHRAKTGALITASGVIGAVAARATPRAVEAVRGFGQEIGMAFQIVDDVLDVTQTAAVLGKTAGKDVRQQKSTFARLLGPDAALTEAHACVERAVDHLGSSGIDSTLLPALARYFVNRRS